MAEPKVRFKREDGSSYHDWEEKRLGDVASRVTRKNKNNETDIPLTIASIEGLIDQRTYFGKTIASKDMSGYYLLNKGEFAYNKSYSKGYDYGSIKRLDNYENGALSTLYICFELNEEENSDFYNCYFNGLSWYSQMREICAEGARNHGLLNVSANDFFDIKLSVPADSKEQEKISNFFEKVDMLIATSEKEVEKLKELKKGCLQKMFPRNGADIPEVRFPEFTDAWEQRKLGEVCDYVDYRGKTPTKTEEGVFLVTAKNVKEGYIDYEVSKEYISEDDYEEVMHRGKPQIGDVLFTTEAPCGNVAQVDRENIALAQRIIKYRGHDGVIDNTFLKQYLLSPVFQSILNAKSTGGTVQGIKGSVLHQQIVTYPRFEEQRKIGDYLEAIDNLITLHQCECEKYKELKKGLLQKMFV